VAGNASTGYHRAVKLPSRAALCAAFRELGPLRPVAVYVAIVPTVGTLTLLGGLAAIAARGPDATWAAAAVLAAIGSVAIAGALLWPSALGFAAGYLVGVERGSLAAVLGIAFGSVVAQRLLAPRLGAARFAFMQGRPRALAVRRFCAGRTDAAALGVARLRWAGAFPLPVTNLLFAVAVVPLRAVWLGSLIGAAPLCLLAALAGAGWRRWHDLGALPEPRAWIVAGAALLGAACLRRAARRAWRAVAAPGA
jgi:hypothetical protein